MTETLEPYIQGSSINSARKKLADSSHDEENAAELVRAAQDELLDAFPDREPTTESERRHFVRWQHVLGDCFAVSGEYEYAEALYNEALASADTLEDTDVSQIYKGLIHVSLAEIARVTDRTEKEVGAHTSEAIRLIDSHPDRQRANLICYFCYRTLMLDSVTRHDRGTARYCLFRLEDLADLPRVKDFVVGYNDSAMNAAAAYIDPSNETTADISSIHEVPPLSAYFTMPD